jgi:pimeloyl-ACP methyl ester carboxylesterase
MGSWLNLNRDGVRLACRDFGGDGQPVLLLHGLAGHADEWAQTASWLTTRCRVVALDARGHGHSERVPGDVSRDAHVADLSFVIEQLGLHPVVLVGQSVGGVTALSLAGESPDLVRGLVVVDASPIGGRDEAESAASQIDEALRRWPVPFASRTVALDFFEQRFGSPLAAEAWADGLEPRDDGWWPRFDIDVMVRTLREAVMEPSWDEWERISCPTLVVHAGDGGVVEPDLAQEMMERLPGTRLAVISDAAHDLHLDRPDEWRETLVDFLDSLDGEPG